MKTAERTRIAFQRGTPDRVPVHCWLGLPLIKKLKPPEKRMYEMLEWWIDDPMGSIVQMQLDLGLDPMITTYSQHIGEHEIWPRMLFPRPLETDTWVETFEETATRRRLARARARDPHARRRPRLLLPHRGRLRHVVPRLPAQGRRAGEEAARAAPLPVRRPLRHDGPEGHGREGRRRGVVAAPRHRAVGHGRGDPRSRRPLDGHLRPPRVRPRPDARLHRLAEAFYRRLGETGIHSISMNETWVGVGVAPDHFREFMKPYDDGVRRRPRTRRGYLVSFHNCGRATLLLEDIADTGPDAIETLTSSRSSGDVDLADAKRRIGDRVCLFGGFNEHLLHEADADAVREEVERCLEAAMEGGGYVLRSTGQIFDAKPGLIEVACETARELGRYN